VLRKPESRVSIPVRAILGHMSEQRDFDVVLFGASGFTGALTAQYLAHQAPTHLRWALAGRSRTKLELVRSELVNIDPRYQSMDLLTADAQDQASLDALAARTRILVTTVGPYLEYGEPLVAACVAHGTDYLDLTGEPEFVDRMYVEHHESAVDAGSRLVHSCGFDSIPHDLGVLFTIDRLRPLGPATVHGVVRARGTFSGGTFSSALGAFARVKQSQQALRDRIKVEPRPVGRSSRAIVGKPGKNQMLGLWVLPLPTIDPQVVARSGAALVSYGPRFRYSHFAGVRRLPVAISGAVSLAGIFAAAQFAPLRRTLIQRMPPGQGPDEARRQKSWFTVDFFAEADGRTLHTKVSGGDPGYTETAKMLAESALCLALDHNPATAGQVTTAAAMGKNLTSRLQKAGITFEVIS
jgi:short subunit dehydrogenase-like uncharacterized protein